MLANSSSNVPVPVVAIASWLVPGAGYWLMGQRARGFVVGATIMALFIGGLLVGGVKVLEVPGYGDHGQPLVVVREYGERRNPNTQQRDVITQDRIAEEPEPGSIGWVMQVHPLDEIRN